MTPPCEARPNRWTVVARGVHGLVALGIIVAMAGCETHHEDFEAFDKAVRTGERPVAMKGEGSFFSGQIAATITISRGIGRGEAPGKQPAAYSTSYSAHDEKDYEAEDNYEVARIKLGSPLPPITIHFMLSTPGSVAQSVDIQDLNSDLGDFAVQPEIVVVPPGKMVQPEPMISQLGVSSDDMPFQVTLRVAGKTETQTIHVKTLPAAPPSATE